MKTFKEFINEGENSRQVFVHVQHYHKGSPSTRVVHRDRVPHDISAADHAATVMKQIHSAPDHWGMKGATLHKVEDGKPATRDGWKEMRPGVFHDTLNSK